MDEEMAANIDKECYGYAKEHFKDLERTAYRVPDVLFPREGQSGDVLTRDEIRSGQHAKHADKKHKNISIPKLLEERHALFPVELIAQRMYNWGTTFKEAMIVLCNYKHANYFHNIPSKKSTSDGEYDIVGMGSFGFVFIQIKAFSAPSNTARGSQGTNSYVSSDREWQESKKLSLGCWQTNHIRKAVEQLINDRKEFLETNKDLSFVELPLMHFVVGIPDVEKDHDEKVREIIEAKLDCCDEGEIADKRMKVLTIYKETMTSQKNFDDWFKRCILPVREKKVLGYDDLYTLVGRYTCRKYSKVSRLGIPGLGTRRSSALISQFRLTDDQQRLLRKNATRQIIAGGFGTGKTLLLLEEAINLVSGKIPDDDQQNKMHQFGEESKGKQPKENEILRENNTNRSLPEAKGYSYEVDHNVKCEKQMEHDGSLSEDRVKGHTKPSFCFILSCSNVGENGIVLNDPDLLVDHLQMYLTHRLVARRKEKNRDRIKIYKLDEVIYRSFPEEKVSHPNISCEMLSMDVLIKVIHDLVDSKPEYTCHFMVNEFPTMDLINRFDWRKLQQLYDEYPMMRLWIALSSEGNMQTYLSCDSICTVQKTLGVPTDFPFGFLQESKRMTKNIYRFMEKTQEYEGKEKREHFRCGIDIEDHKPMWVPMPRCSCGGIEGGFFECTCMCSRLTTSLREVFKRIPHLGNDNIVILLLVIVFAEVREKLVDLLTRALRNIKVGCRVKIPKLEQYSFTLAEDEFNGYDSLQTCKQVTLTHNRYFHGCEGKVMIVFPPLGGPQFQPFQDGHSLAMAFDNVIARAISRLFIITPTERGMIQYSKELCKYIDNEKSRQTNPAKNAKWDHFRRVFECREKLPSYLTKMVKEEVLLKCSEDDELADDESVEVDTLGNLTITDAPLTKFYMTY